jgi:C1A family cysteine protease
MRHAAHRFTHFAALCCCAVLPAIGMAAPAGAGGATAPAGSALKVSAAPLNPAYLQSLVGPPLGAPSSAAVGQALGSRPGPQDSLYTRGMQVPAASTRGTLPATYDLRTLSRVTAVKNQEPYGTCWAFAALGSLESCLLTGETWDFSENNMVLTSGFNYPGTLYDAGGQIFMSTAYLVRWGGPVNESEDAYGDATPPGLTPRKHVQEVNWIPLRGSATDNDNIKNAVMLYGGADVSMGWYDSSYKAAKASYYYNGSSGTNHEVLIVGWNDNYAAANFATTPAGNGAFIVKNSWGASWGSNGYFYVSYYDTQFGRGGNPTAVFDNAEPTSNYTGIYQYDPLGDCNDYGYSSSTGWFANVFTASASASLSAVGFYTLAPGTSYEVYTGSSLATKTLRTSGTQAYMGYHTVTLPAPVAVTNGQQFVVAIKVTSPGTTYPIAFEAPYSGYSSAATAQAGQSYVSSTGTSWTDLTTRIANANVCLKAYVKTSVVPAPTVTSFTPTSGPVGAVVTVTGTGFTGATAVAFNGAPATTFSVASATQITATVPDGATTGAITVTAPGGTGTSAASFGVTAATSITVTVPAGAESWPEGSPQTLGLTLSSAVSAGEFGVWLVDQADPSKWYTAGFFPAVPGAKTYAPSFSTLGVPAGAYKAVVYYRVDTGAWVWQANATSPGAATITAAAPSITVTVPPAGGASWPLGSTQDLGWTLSSPVSAGEFGVWLVDQADPSKWYAAGFFPAVPGAKTYAPTFSTLGVPAGAYKAVVYYRIDPGQWVWQANATSPGATTITP